MATVKTTMTGSWQLVAAATAEFIAENQSSYDVHITFADSLPSAGAPYHVLGHGDKLTRFGITGALYARDASAGVGQALKPTVLVVSS